MRLLFVSRSLPFHHLGGMEAVAWDLARALVMRGNDVEILTTRCSNLKEFNEKDGVRIRTVDARSGRYSKRFWEATVECYSNEYRHRVDAILGIGMGAHAIALNRSPGDKPALIMQSHGQPWGEFLSKLSVKSPISWMKSPKNLLEFCRETTLRRYDRIVAVGPSVANVLNRTPTRWMRGDVPVSVISNGVDLNHFKYSSAARKDIRDKFGIDAVAPVVMSVCRLHVQKGLLESLQGFKRALQVRPELRYLIVGSGPAETRLRTYVTEHGLAGAVIFTGAVDRLDIPRYLSAGDQFIFTSKRQEGLALGPLEAAASGMPSILSTHLAIEGLAALTVEPDSSDEIAQAILSRLAKVTDSRQSILPRTYSLDKASEEYELMFRSNMG